MNFLKIAIAAFSATNVMTTFSFLLSNHYGKLFKEPVLLNYALHGIGITMKSPWKKAGGWLAHYIIGLLFVVGYSLVWTYTDIKFGWVSGILMGIASGMIGIIGWRLIYLLPDKKPAAPLRQYYIQLFFGHIIFACVVVIAFTLYEYDPMARMGITIGSIMEAINLC